jgi:PXPV repeat (3 copies)
LPALQKEKMMRVKSSVGVLAGAAALVALALGSSTAALAGDVFWSVGLSSPGVQVGVFSPQPVYVQPQPYYAQPQVYVQPPVYAQPQVIYTQPRPVYVQPQPVYVQPRPVYVQPQPVVVYNGWNHSKHGWHHGHQVHPRQVVQTYPVRYQTAEPVYGHGERQR